MYKVLINDGMNKEGLDIFQREGISFVNENREGQNLLDTLGEFDALLVRSKTKVTREVIEAGAKGVLRMVGRGGVGIDSIDTDAANEYGIVVKSAPNGVTNSTAEHAIALMFAVSRKIPQAHYALKSGVWVKTPFTGIELEGKTLGIIGCGRIGQSVARKARALGMEVMGYDVNPNLIRELFPDSVIKYAEMNNVLHESDIVSLHTGTKKQIIGAEELALMKPTAILINASRGNNVSEEALYSFLSVGKLYGAGLDSYVNEPKNNGDPITEHMKHLSALENVVLAPHLGASTKEGQRRTSIELARLTVDYLNNSDFLNSVNTKKSAKEAKPYVVSVHHQNIPGMFGQMSQVFGNYKININQISTEQFQGSGTAVTGYITSQPVQSDVLDKLRKINGVKRVLYTNPYE